MKLRDFCRAFGLALIAATSSASGRAELTPLPESAKSTVGYESVAEALAAMQVKPGVVLTTENGWLIATDEAALAIWSFAPENYPAYPAVVKRQAVPNGIGSIIKMDVHCEASKTACDNLVRTFAKMNLISLDR